MTDVIDKPVDVFANMDLSMFDKPKAPAAGQGAITPPPPEPSTADKAQLRALAEEAHFTSRQAAPPPVKPKAIAKSFSLFPEEHHIVAQALSAYLATSDATLTKASGSDVVRAALHEFAGYNLEEQARLIAKHRGRGRLPA